MENNPTQAVAPTATDKLSLADCYTAEHKRGMNDINVIYLHKQGVLYKGYEWSAWLAHHYPNHRADGRPLTPTKLQSTCDANGVVTVALPEASFASYFPGASMRRIDDKTVAVTVDQTKYTHTFAQTDCKKSLDEWKAKVNYKEKAHKQKPNIYSAGSTGVFGIASTILKFQLDGANADQMRAFITKVQNMARELI